MVCLRNTRRAFGIGERGDAEADAFSEIRLAGADAGVAEEGALAGACAGAAKSRGAPVRGMGDGAARVP